jgi:hypothetical protein
MDLTRAMERAFICGSVCCYRVVSRLALCVGSGMSARALLRQ